MDKLTLTLLLTLLSACASVTPNYDAKFGDAVRTAQRQQTINPEAGKIPDDVTGLDGKAAQEGILLYQRSFKTPPPVTNVINIGGSLGSGGGGN